MFHLEEGLYIRYPRVGSCPEDGAREEAALPEGEKIVVLRLSHRVELLFSQRWIQANLTGMEERLSPLEEFIHLTGERLIGEIESELLLSPLNRLALRASVLLLLSNAVGRLAGQQGPPLAGISPLPLPTPPGKTWYEQAMQQVEQRLMQSLEERLPSLKELAREFALSESTLKRHFKAVYGKGLYEYYLGKKMELAKWLLQEKKISVSETAYMLGYEKVSAFIGMFKKYHKIRPGSLKQGAASYMKQAKR